MKQIIKLTCICCVLFMFLKDVQPAEIITIVSIPPQKFFVKKIAGDFVDIEVLIPPGANPTTFEPKPRQIRKIKEAVVYFAIGVPFEKVWLKRIKNINSKLKIIKHYKNIVRIPMSNRYNRTLIKQRDISEDFLDPHIWLSPTLVRLIMQDIRDFFESYDSAHKDFYLSNYLDLLKQIDKLDEELSSRFSHIQNRYFLVFHPSWGYFARDYGLCQIPIELEGKKPSPSEISSLIHFARVHKIKVVFIQPQFSQKIARIIASEINAKVEQIDPLAEDWAENLKKVSIKIANSLR